MTPTTAILLTGILCAAACALPGTFLVLRRMAMMTDAISHAILPGLVAGYVLASGPNLLTGTLGAVAAAIVTVTLVEALQRTSWLDGGAAMGIVFPAMFALGTVMVSRWFANVHLDTDAILYGNIEFAFFDRLVIAGRDLGPRSIWVMCALLVINIALLGFLYKEMKITTFDPGMAAMLGFTPAVVHYVLMLALSITTVGAFTAVGAILVVALVIVPAATARLLTDRLPVMIGLSVVIGAASAWTGYELALWLDTSVSGAMVTMLGAFFGTALLLSPSHGLVARALRHRANARRFAVDLLVAHLAHHEGVEHTAANAGAALRWGPDQSARVVGRAVSGGYVASRDGRLALTERGQERAATLA